MNQRTSAWVLMGLVVLTAGCEKRKATEGAVFSVSDRLVAESAPGPQAEVVVPSLAHRYIAEHHDLTIVTPESGLEKASLASISLCNSMSCEVLSSKIASRAADSVPYGSASFRIIPQQLDSFLASVEKLGTLAEHTTQRDDKTTDVVDAEAKIKNLTDFRDNLRAMLTRSSATVKDLIEIQQQLEATQSELDGEVASRKILANETEKVSVDVTFQVEETRRGAGAFGAIRDALRQSGSVLGASTASLITFLVAVVPWLIPLVFVIWLLAKLWRRVRRQRKVSPIAPAARE